MAEFYARIRPEGKKGMEYRIPGFTNADMRSTSKKELLKHITAFADDEEFDEYPVRIDIYDKNDNLVESHRKTESGGKWKSASTSISMASKALGGIG